MGAAVLLTGYARQPGGICSWTPHPSLWSRAAGIPFFLLQFIKGSDDQKEGEQPESECAVRFVFATYSEDGGKGAMDVLNLITRIRVALIKAGVIGEQFSIKRPIEYIVYPDSTPPYFMGEMMTIWEMPTIQREVPLYDELCGE